MNRSIYNFNDSVDKAFSRPVAKGYRQITPKPVRTGFRNFFSNLREVRNIINDILQLKIPQAGSDFGRLLANSTLGIAGFFDVATPLGLARHDEDFGQTLGYWGVGAGPYLVLPLLGPNSVRDTGGLVVDIYVNPTREVDIGAGRWALYALDLISLRAELLEASQILTEAAFDPYIFLREAYLQRRRNLVYDGSPPQAEPEIDIFSD